MQSNKLITPSKNQQEYRKIFCAYHKTEFLTNFCVQKNCLMPLCPSCIVDHTQQHYRQSSKPLYMNLHQALYDVKQSCLSHINEFEIFSEKLRDISEFKKRLVKQVHNQLVRHKQEMYMHIERLFMKYEEEVYNLVMVDYDREGLYKQDDINSIEYRVKDTINQLYDKIGSLKGDQCLATLILYYGQERERVIETKSQCEKFMLRHDTLKIQTSLNENSMKKHLENIFEDIIDIHRQSSQKEYRQTEGFNKSPDKNASLISQSRRSKIFPHSGSKYVSPQKSNGEPGNGKDRGTKFYDSRNF